MRNDGTKLEGKVQDALKAARNLIANQPGDFLMTLPGAAILIECKSTWDGASFWSLLDATQLAKHRLWQRAGHPTVFFYGNHRKGEVALYRGDAVIDMHVHNSPRGDLVLGGATFSTVESLIEVLATEYVRAS
jgi:hypothetical protein